MTQQRVRTLTSSRQSIGTDGWRNADYLSYYRIYSRVASLVRVRSINENLSDDDLKDRLTVLRSLFLKLKTIFSQESEKVDDLKIRPLWQHQNAAAPINQDTPRPSLDSLREAMGIYLVHDWLTYPDLDWILMDAYLWAEFASTKTQLLSGDSLMLVDYATFEHLRRANAWKYADHDEGKLLKAQFKVYGETFLKRYVAPISALGIALLFKRDAPWVVDYVFFPGLIIYGIYLLNRIFGFPVRRKIHKGIKRVLDEQTEILIAIIKNYGLLAERMRDLELFQQSIRRAVIENNLNLFGEFHAVLKRAIRTNPDGVLMFRDFDEQKE